MDHGELGSGEQVARAAETEVSAFLAPLLRRLDVCLDRRLVGTLLGSVVAIVCWRNRAHGLVLSLTAYPGNGTYCTVEGEPASGPRAGAPGKLFLPWQPSCLRYRLRQRSCRAIRPSGASMMTSGAAWRPCSWWTSRARNPAALATTHLRNGVASLRRSNTAGSTADMCPMTYAHRPRAGPQQHACGEPVCWLQLSRQARCAAVSAESSD